MYVFYTLHMCNRCFLIIESGHVVLRTLSGTGQRGEKTRAEPYSIAITTLSELLLSANGDQNVGADRLRNCNGFAFLVALFRSIRGLMVLLTHCVL